MADYNHLPPEELIAKSEELKANALKYGTWTKYAFGIIALAFVMAGFGLWAETHVRYTDTVGYIGFGWYIIVRVFLKRDNDKEILQVDAELATQADRANAIKTLKE